MNETPSQESPAETLARSAFGFAFISLIPAIITWIGFLLAPPSPDPTFRTIRLVILGGFGLIVLLLLWVTVYFFRTPQEKLLPLAQWMSNLLSKKWFAIVLVFLLLEINLLAFLLLNGIASSITNPTKFLLICWSLVFLGIIFTVNRASFSQWLEQTKGLWISTGLLIFTIAIGGILLMLNSWLVGLTGLNDVLRGGLDYRQLEFYDDGQPMPSAAEFWAEQAQTRVRWSPYTYWVLDEFHGEFINVDADGIRQTPNFADDSAKNIYFFGGSTMWGEGARDAYTIAGHMARLLNEDDTPQNIVNYGQTGYVSTQDLIWFQLQLIRGNVPDAAVFYQGFNDVLGAWGNDAVGVTLQETMRLNDAEAGRILRSGQPVLRLPNFDLAQLDMSQAAVENLTAENIANRWFDNVEMIESLAEAYGVKVVFVWQPAIIFKDILSESEQAIYERTENERSGLFELYREVDTLVQDRIAEGEYDNIVVLSELFADSDEAIFHDLVHITEIGNAYVAEAILPYLNRILDKN